MAHTPQSTDQPVLWLMRHADRCRIETDALSQFGLNQALSLASVFQKLQGKTPTSVLSSPKKRTLATVQPLIQSATDPIALTSDPRLEERHSHETRAEFQARVVSVLSDCIDRVFGQKQVRSLLLVSHIDWLLEATQALDSTEPEHLQTTPFAPFELRGYTQQDGSVLLQRIH